METIRRGKWAKGLAERRARHAQGAHQRLELEVLDRDAAAKGRLQRALVGAGDRSPAHRVEEGVELGGVVEAVGVQRGELGLLSDLRAGLDLPDDLQILAGGVVLHRDQRDEVLDGAAVAGGLRVAGDPGDHPHPPAHARELALLGRGGGWPVL